MVPWGSPLNPSTDDESRSALGFVEVSRHVLPLDQSGQTGCEQRLSGIFGPMRRGYDIDNSSFNLANLRPPRV